MTMNYKPDIEKAMAQARALQERILTDDNLSDVGKANRITREVQPLRDGARQQASWWLADLEKRGNELEARLGELKHKQAVAVDHSRRLYHQTRVNAVIDHGAWQDVAEAMQDDLTAADGDALAVWLDLAPKVRGRFDPRTGPQSDPAGGVVTMQARIKQAVQASEPPEIAATLKELTVVADALHEAKSYLNREDMQEGYARRPAVFRDVLNPKPATVTVGDDSGKYYITMSHTDRGPFG